MVHFISNSIFRFLFGFLFFLSFNTYAQSKGCTDPLANNYNPTATLNDGTCTYNKTSVNVDSTWLLPSEMIETSGLLFLNDSLLTFNDDTDTSLYLFPKENPQNFRTIPLSKVHNQDWEEVSQDSLYLYIGDVGNNVSGNRQNLKIYRISKNELGSNVNTDTISFSYNLQTDFSAQTANQTDFDCEAFIVGKDKIYLFSKEWISEKTKIYALDKNPGNHIAVAQDSFDVEGLITGATFFEKEQLVVLSGYTQLLQPFVYLFYDYLDNDFFAGNKRRIDINLLGHQVEGIASQDGLQYYISNEKFVRSPLSVDAKLHRLDLSPYLSNYLLGDTSGNSNPSQIATILPTKEFQIYPNPSGEQLQIRMSSEFQNNLGEWMIVHSSGKQIARIPAQKTGFQIDLKKYNLPNGLYYLIFQNQEQQFSRSFIYKR